MNKQLEQQKNILGERIKLFLSTNENYKKKGGRARIEFCKKVNQLTGTTSDDIACYKRVSRWISGEAFPDLPAIYAIAKVMNVTIEELFQTSAETLRKLQNLDEEDTNVLKKLIQCADEQGNASSLFLPISFMGESINGSGKFFTRDEVIAEYKRRVIPAFQIEQMKTFFNNESNRAKAEKNINKMAIHFSRYCSVAFIENHEKDEKDPIFYSNTTEYYKEIAQLWEKEENDNFFNVIFFEQRDFSLDDYDILSLDKALYYKNKAMAEKLYTKTFGNLIKEGLLSPLQPVKDVPYWDDGSQTVDTFLRDKVLSVFTDNYYDYTLATITFSFKINLGKHERDSLLTGGK